MTGAAKGDEERELVFGRLFGFLTLVRSDRLRNDSTTSKSIETEIIISTFPNHLFAYLLRLQSIYNDGRLAVCEGLASGGRCGEHA